MDQDQIPRRGNNFTRKLANALYRLTGWQVTGSFPNLPKFIIIGVPHTSNWDFPLAMSFIFQQGVRINWMAKHTLFRWPFRRILDWLGGVPVNRNATRGLVGEIIDEFQRRRQMVLALSPEGTRSKVDRWRTGFYHMAHGARIPIVPVQVDYARKTLGICPPFYTSGDIEHDLPLIKAHFEGITGKNKHQY